MHRLVLGLVLVLLGGAAQAADPERGLQLARTWCAQCHIVAPGDAGSDAGPPFSVVAGSLEPDGEFLRQWLLAPHEPMPFLDLADPEVDDLRAYIQSLAP